MKTRLLVSTVAVAFALAACGGGGSSSSTGGGSTGGSTGGGGTVVNAKYSDYLQDGIYYSWGSSIGQTQGSLSNGVWTKSYATTLWDSSQGAFPAFSAPTPSHGLEEFIPGASTTWAEPPSTASENADGSLQQGIWQYSLQAIDIAGKRLVDYAPFASYGTACSNNASSSSLCDNLSITDGATFSNGAKLLITTTKARQAVYQLWGSTGSSSSGQSLTSNDDLIRYFSGTNSVWVSDNTYVLFDAADAGKTSGNISNIPGATWTKVKLSDTVEVIEFAGLPVDTSDPYRIDGSSFITAYKNSAYVGRHYLAGQQPGRKTSDNHREAAFNKIAIDDLKANTHSAANIGGIAGYGTALNAKTALQNGLNYLWRDNSSGDLKYSHYALKTNADGSLEQDGGNGYVYTFDSTQKKFIAPAAAKPRNGIYLDASKKAWSLLTGNNSLTVQPDGAALLGNTWNGGQIKASFSAVDLNGKYLADFDPTGLLSSYFKPYAKFSSGAQWLSQRYVQQTAGYTLWNPTGIGYSSLDALLAADGIYAWIGQTAKVKFVPGAAGATTGTLQVTDSWGNALGNGTWARKTVNGVEILEITSLPAGAAKDYFANNIHLIYSVYNGAVCEGMAVLPGKVLTSDFPTLFNDQAIKDIVAAVK